MTSCHLVFMEINKGFFILFVFIHFVVHYSKSCDNMDTRPLGSISPITEMSFIPDDDTFAVGTLLSIVCTGKKTESSIADEKLTYPDKIVIYVDDKANRDHCGIARNDTRPVKTCVLKVNITEPGTLSVICVVDNIHSCSYHKKTIYIKEGEKPHLAQRPPRHINATEGQDLNITCISRAVPRPLITWYKDDVIISSNKSTWYRGTSTLMFNSIDSTSQGKYICKANNSLGVVSSNGSFVTVFFRPVIILGPVNQTVAMGTRVSLECNVTGLPIPVIGWLKDGVVLRSGNESDDRNLTGSRMSEADVVSKLYDMTFDASSITPSANYTRKTTTGNDVTRNPSSSLLPTSTFTRPIPPLTSTFATPTSQLTNAITKPISSSTSTVTRPIPPSTSTVIRPIPSSTITVIRPIPSSTITVIRPIPPSTSTVIRPIPPIERPFPGKTTQNGRHSTLVIESVAKDAEGKYQCYAKNAIGNATSRHAIILVYIPDIFQSNVSSSSGINALIPALGTLLPVLLVVMVILLIFIRIKRKKLSQLQNTTLALSNSILSQAQKDNNTVEGIRNEGVNEEFHDDAVYLLLMGIDRDWEISRDRLLLTNQRLGAGCFGQVDKGIYTRKDRKEMFVAVKTLKDPGVQTDRDDILAELDMLKRVGRHRNVVSLVGACTQDDPLCIIIEFVEGGNLNDLLIKARLPANREKPYENIRSRLTERDLVKMAADVARGMKHLHDKNCIHRDLAARNILIGPGLVAKIADFGLARHVIDGFYVKQSPGKVPWKWMAPEALQGLFTTKTDVWSFGILLWEMATLGDSPYSAITQLVVLYNLLSNGYRMPKPDHCHEMLYSVMMDCWSADSNKRPGFEDIYKMLEKMLNQKERIYINLEEMDQEELDHQF